MNKNITLVFFGIFFITSCVNNSLQPDVVSRSDAQKQQYVVFGTISDVTKVTIEGDREAGAAAGRSGPRDLPCLPARHRFEGEGGAVLQGALAPEDAAREVRGGAARRSARS